MVLLKNINFTTGDLILFQLGWPLGRPWGLWGPFWDLLWISPVGPLALDAFWGPFCMLLGLFPSSFKAFGHPMETFLLVSSMTFILQRFLFQIRISVYHVSFLCCRM